MLASQLPVAPTVRTRALKYNEVKERHNVTLTDWATDQLLAWTEATGLSRSETIERLVRGLFEQPSLSRHVEGDPHATNDYGIVLTPWAWERLGRWGDRLGVSRSDMIVRLVSRQFVVDEQYRAVHHLGQFTLF
ncbi:MAG: hypothetical protein AAFX40_11040 [Cyanobacteria bacterium J06639_1]